MEIIQTVPHAFGLSAAGGPEGWAVACKTLEDIDDDFVKKFKRYEFELRLGKTAADWGSALASLGWSVRLMSTIDGKSESAVLTEAERVHGPAVAWCGGPVVVWTERADGAWRLMLHDHRGLRCLHESDGILRAPAVAISWPELLVACEYERHGETHVGVWNDQGRHTLEVEGRKPVLAGSTEGTAWLAYETPIPNAVRLSVQVFDKSAPCELIQAPPAEDINMNAHLVHDPQTGTLYATWESCGAWGYMEMLGMHRNISLWALEKDADAFRPATNTYNGLLKLPQEGYLDRTEYNYCPIRPRVVLLESGPAVAWQTFRNVGQKAFAWDVWLVAASKNGWDAPRRLSPNTLIPDGGYALLPDGNDMLGVFCCGNTTPILSFNEVRSETLRRQPERLREIRAEVVRLGAGERLPDVERPPDFRAHYRIPPPAHDAALDPPELSDPPDGLQLIWGDLHSHTAYSKCMSGNDGLPDDVLRFQRDVLGSRVLCLTDHIEYMSGPEIAHVFDCLEAECGDTCVPLYAVEWAMKPAHHTNFYAIDREIFERLRAILLELDHLTPIYARIKKELPEGSVVALRHFHGVNEDEFGTNGEKVCETHDPVIEVAMEAMQTRGNMMMPDNPYKRLFPSNFLDYGAKIGLYGGSDHSRGGGVNSYCLTGFWVPEITPEAVWQALRERHTLAMSNGKVAIYPTLDGAVLGSAVTTAVPVKIRAQLSCARTIRRVCLIRDSELLTWGEVNDTSADIELVDDTAPPGRHWYVVTAEADTEGLKQHATAHASPFFVEVTA